MAPAAKRKSISTRRQQAITRALADPRRFAILKRIAAGEDASACSALRACFPIAAATLSHHLRELEAAGLIETTKRGRFVDVHFCREVWTLYLETLGRL